MIEPEYSHRLGLTISPESDGQLDERTIAAWMGTLGLRHLRIVLDGESALVGLAKLGAQFDVLLSIQACDADLLGCLLERHAESFDAIELLFAAQCETEQLLAAVQRARNAGKRVVIGLSDAQTSQMSALGQAGAFSGVHAVSAASWNKTVGFRKLWAAGTFTPGLQLWVTSAGAQAERHDPGGQARTLLSALHTKVARLYWGALQDRSSVDGGLLNEAGEPKLLARLLMSGGVGEVERVIATTPGVTPTIKRKTVLVTGGAGFIGANLADRLATDGHQVHVFDALARPGVERNLRWLTKRHPAKISVTLGDLRDEPALEAAAANASCVFHLAGQVAVTTSMVRPLDDFEVNARGTLALLDALRRCNPQAPLIFASTNKVYGDLADIELAREGDRYLPTRADIRAHGVSEMRPLCFHTPYGCSKGTADQYVLDYAHSFGLRTAVLRMSCIYGERQFGTEDQGWVAHFLLRAIAGEPVTIYGDGRQVRDVLHVGDAVAAYLAAWRDIDAIAGRAYNLGGGAENAISLLQLIECMESMLGTRMDVTFAAWRPGDQRYFVADTQAIRRDLRLAPALGWRAGLRRLAEYFGATLLADTHVAEPAL